MDTIVILALVVAIAYIVFYLRGRYYNREEFQDGGRNCRTVLDTTSQQYKPYVTNQDKYGDFEADFVYQNEGGYDPTKEAINVARRRFPFDWSQLPPSSSLFQAQQSLFVKDNTATAAPYALETFTNIESKKVLPPDGTEDQAETDSLKMYKPVMTSDMKSVDEKSVKELIDKIYGDRGMVAKVAKEANNVFEVYEVQEKNPKIIYEDDLQTTSSMQSNALNPMVEPTEMLVTPDGVSDVVPYTSGENTRNGRQSYNDYNPNLEGIFGPKMQWQQWG